MGGGHLKKNYFTPPEKFLVVKIFFNAFLALILSAASFGIKKPYKISFILYLGVPWKIF